VYSQSSSLQISTHRALLVGDLCLMNPCFILMFFEQIQAFARREHRIQRV